MIAPGDEAKAMQALQARHDKPNSPGKQYRYRLVPFEELRPGTKSSFLIAGVIPRAGLVAVWGPPKCGKSFWTFDLVLHIALGWKYRGRRVYDGGPVVYMAFEGAEGFNARAEAFRRSHEITGKVPFFLIGSNAKLVRDHQALIEAINGQMNAPPVAVVLDTLNRSIDGSENKDQDMGAYLAAAETIHQEFDCVVLIVHHCGVDGTRPRGHTSLTGAVDSQIAVKRDGANNIVAEVEAMKDAAEGARFTSALKVVEVGTNDEGQPITSCVIIPAEPVHTDQNKGPKLSPIARAALDQLYRVIESEHHPKKGKMSPPRSWSERFGGAAAPPEDVAPSGTKIVTLEQWRNRLDVTGIINKKGGHREQFKRLRVTLQNAGIIGVWEEFVWAVT